MNMLKSFLLDEMFPNVCDKLCKLFSKQKTFNFTQHIPPWKGKQKRDAASEQPTSCGSVAFGGGLSAAVAQHNSREVSQAVREGVAKETATGPQTQHPQL